MKIKELKSKGLSHELEVTVPANDIDARVEMRLKEAGKAIRLPGFRPGKAPMNILKQRYGKAVMGEVLEQTVNETSRNALDEKKIKPAMQPKIEVKSFDEGKDLVYTMEVEAIPPFEIADLKGLELEKKIVKADEEAVQNALENIAASRQETKPIEGKRGAKDGDVVVIDFHGRTADDNVEHEGMHAHGHHLRLGSGQFIPGFEEQLIGKKAGEKVEVKVDFPENYKADLAGRPAIFDVEIHEIREPSEAEINDELAQSFGLKNLKELKENVQKQVQIEFDQQSRMHLKRAVLDILDEKHKFEVPQGMLDMEYEAIIKQVEAENEQAGVDVKLSDAEKKEFKEISERRVRLGLVLSEIGQKNDIKVGEGDLQKAAIAEAQKYPGQEQAVFEYFAKNPQAIESLRAPIYEEKVVDYILELADIKEVEVSREDLEAELNEDEDKPKKKTAKKSTAKKSSAKKDDEKKSASKKPAAKKAPAKKSAAKKK